MTDDADRFAEAFDVSRETRDRLTRYADLLKKWNPAINLVSRTTLPHLWTRHFTDSAQLLEIADTPNGTWVDLGSGGGFPGMIVAGLCIALGSGIYVGATGMSALGSVFPMTIGAAPELTNCASNRVPSWQT